MVDFRSGEFYLLVIDCCLISFGYRAETARALSNLPSKIVLSAAHPRWGTLCAMKGFIMTNGTVKWFNSTKGFGFIQPDNGGPDAFVHISAVERSGMREIVEGQKLAYDMERDNKSGKMSAGQLQAA